MANSLKREIDKHEILIVKKKLVGKDYQDISKRLFVAFDGFGMSSETRGSKVFGFDARIERGIIILEKKIQRDGFDFDEKETRRWQSATKIYTLDNRTFNNEADEEVVL